MRILLFGGTAEGHALAQRLAQAGYPVTCCVATDYGRDVLEPQPNLTVRMGRMDQRAMEAEMAKGYDILLEIDYHGGLRVKEAYPDAVLVFIAPPTIGELKKRLIGRQSESEEMLEVRMRTAQEEISMMDRYDYVIVNDEVERAVDTLEAIVCAEKCRMDRNGWMIEKLKEEL